MLTILLYCQDAHYCQDTLQLRDRGTSGWVWAGLASGEILVGSVESYRAVCHYCHYRLASYVIWSGPSTSTSTGPVATKELELERRAPLSTDTTPLGHILERDLLF